MRLDRLLEACAAIVVVAGTIGVCVVLLVTSAVVLMAFLAL